MCLKELRESRRALRLIAKAGLTEDMAATDGLLSETDELVRIFSASIRTANKKIMRENGDDNYRTAAD